MTERQDYSDPRDEGHYDDNYYEDEYEVAEDELCDCGKCHFSECYEQGCFGMFFKKDWYDDDDEELEGDDTAFWWDGSEPHLPETPAASNNGVPPADLSDIPF